MASGPQLRLNMAPKQPRQRAVLIGDGEIDMKTRIITIFTLAACFAVMHLATRAEAGAIEIPAWSFARGNARVVPNPDPYFDYRDIQPDLVVVAGDKLPWSVEYDVDIPVATNYVLKVRYASEESRPIELWFDGRKVATCCADATGNSETYADRLPAHDEPRRANRIYGAKWEEVCRFSVSKGTHTLKLTLKAPAPCLLSFRLNTPESFPRGWQPTSPSVAFDINEGWMWRIKYAARTRYAMGFARAHPTMNMDRIPPTYRYALSPPGTVNAATLRLAIEDKIASLWAASMPPTSSCGSASR